MGTFAEDCAQAFGARVGGRHVGTFGTIGCFSTQQGKHMTTGEGGIVVTDDPALARRLYLLINKAWGYGDPQPDHYFLALNYRASELQERYPTYYGAAWVAIARLWLDTDLLGGCGTAAPGSTTTG